MVFSIKSQNILHISDAFIKGYVNFADFQPSTEKDQDCFVMRSAENYEWSTVNCDIQYPFICMLGELFMVHVRILMQPAPADWWWTLLINLLTLLLVTG